jgi:hypothetical protein
MIPILFWYETLHVSGIFSVHHQEFSTVQSQDGTASSILTLLEAVIKNLHETYQCRIYSRKLLIIGTEDARNM